MLKVSAAGKLSITQTDGTYGYTQDSNGNIVITADGSYTISGSNTTGGISVQSGVTANIILDGVNLNFSRNYNDQSQCAFSIVPGASVNLTLKGNNTLISGRNHAGLFVPSGASVIIMEQIVTVLLLQAIMAIPIKLQPTLTTDMALASAEVEVRKTAAL